MTAFLSEFQSGRVVVTLPNRKIIIVENFDKLQEKLSGLDLDEFQEKNCISWEEKLLPLVEYNNKDGVNLFNDRGNKVTFDRVHVSDEEIRTALVHAQHKFGKQLTLTGDDPTFTARMARLAEDMGMTILNPELQSVITQHREAKARTNFSTKEYP